MSYNLLEMLTHPPAYRTLLNIQNIVAITYKEQPFKVTYNTINFPQKRTESSKKMIGKRSE